MDHGVHGASWTWSTNSDCGKPYPIERMWYQSPSIRMLESLISCGLYSVYITFGAQSICWSGWWAELWDSGIGILAVAVTCPGVFSFFNLRAPVARPEALHDGAISAVFNIESVESTCYLPVGHSIQRVWNLNRWSQLQHILRMYSRV